MTIASKVPRLHVITDEVLQSRFDHAALAEMAFAGGAGVVQLREKRARTTRTLVETARSMSGGTLIVNDRADVAAAVGAGVHVGDDDLPPALARRIVGPDVLVGASASTPELLRSIGPEVDYVGVGPVFGTSSKGDAGDRLGLDGLRALLAAANVPVIAIGGITIQNAASVLATGVHGIAVLSAIVCADDPRAATAAFAEIVGAS